MKFKKLTAITIILSILSCFSIISVSASDYSITDVSDIQKHIAGLIVLPDEKQKEFDFNHDGVLSVLDSTYLQMILAGIIIQGTTQASSDIFEETTNFLSTVPSTQPVTAEPTESTTVIETAEPTEEPSTAITAKPTEPSATAETTVQTEPSDTTEPTQPTTTVYPTRIELNKTTLTLGAG